MIYIYHNFFLSVQLWTTIESPGRELRDYCNHLYTLNVNPGVADAFCLMAV